MRETEILLRENVKNLGRCGDIVRVAPGYARNYLVPNKIGIEATEDNKKAMERRRVRLDTEEAALFAELEDRLKAYGKLELKTVQRCDDHGHLYGSVNAKLIVKLLAEVGQTVDEKAVRISEPIKSVGEHSVSIHLHAERSGEITVKVEGENGMTEVVKPQPRAAKPEEAADSETAKEIQEFEGEAEAANEM
ncbi:MAG: large subunit ribosomal protein L9 [Planctomycetota bacterium]|jgi:large subunit ribosomal protein L9